MKNGQSRFVVLLTLIVLGCQPLARLQAQRRIQDICRIKGQERNTLTGVGLVVGLNGTGDSVFPVMTRALARMLANAGLPIPVDQLGQDQTVELKGVKNVAVVFVTATVPAAGIRQGEEVNCTVHTLGNAKSLAGGRLMMAVLYNGMPRHTLTQKPFAYASGKIILENSQSPVTGSVFHGCRFHQSVVNQFWTDGHITLVIDKDHANFQTANAIAHLINKFPEFRYRDEQRTREIAKAIDQVNVEVRIPEDYIGHEVQFAAAVLDMTLVQIKKDARVVINEDTGTIVIGDNVVISPVAITHKNFTVEAGPFFPLSAGQGESGMENRPVRLRSLVDALNELKAEPQDIIDIIKMLKASGALYADLRSN